MGSEDPLGVRQYYKVYFADSQLFMSSSIESSSMEVVFQVFKLFQIVFVSSWVGLKMLESMFFLFPDI